MGSQKNADTERFCQVKLIAGFQISFSQQMCSERFTEDSDSQFDSWTNDCMASDELSGNLTEFIADSVQDLCQQFCCEASGTLRQYNCGQGTGDSCSHCIEICHCMLCGDSSAEPVVAERRRKEIVDAMTRRRAAMPMTAASSS